jgi:hypothetical protein
MKFTSALFRQRISDVLTAAASLRRDTPGSGRQSSATKLRRRSTEVGRIEDYAGPGLEEVSRSVEALSQRLDLFAVESTRRQNQTESLSRSAIARMDLLLQRLRAEGEASPTDAQIPTANAPAKMVLIAEIDGHRVGVPGRDWKLAWNYLLRGGLEPGLERFMRRVLKPGMSFVDAGAGVGAYTILAAVLVGRDGSVISLEPDPKAYSILVWNLDRNGLTTELGIRHGVELIASLEKAAIPGIDSDRPCVDLMRIGAEQVSPELLPCLSRISSRSPRIYIILEYCASLAGTTIPPLEFLDRIVSHGFSVQKVDAESGECSPVNPEEFASAFSTNLVVRRV